jgi:hypothetical protein
MRKTWQVELLIFKDEEHGDRDSLLVLLDDQPWLRAHYDGATDKWIETSTEHIKGLMRNEQRTANELVVWLLTSRTSQLVQQIGNAVLNHFASRKDREQAARLNALRQKAESDQ